MTTGIARFFLVTPLWASELQESSVIRDGSFENTVSFTGGRLKPVLCIADMQWRQLAVVPVGPVPDWTVCLCMKRATQWHSGA